MAEAGVGGCWDGAGRGSQGWQQDKPLPGTAVGRGSWGSLVWLVAVQGWQMDGQILLAQPAAPLGLSAVTALETQLSDLAQK